MTHEDIPRDDDDEDGKLSPAELRNRNLERQSAQVIIIEVADDAEPEIVITDGQGTWLDSLERIAENDSVNKFVNKLLVLVFLMVVGIAVWRITGILPPIDPMLGL